ncbi:Holliday junction branch migration protein RuvA [Parachitinimonas caeni]|uniref:Holliday junction branch migration complex subunit RuvA n=1 Tax=Parachitinimonas caeni TaxID=3031301 RepID=A0ABT7DR22_9NEIS|nr:Holliday junction branch migration protein RuvA [Parachitinimonas caeni]MDK2122523.1 Holliday junction branch migration protein RuvA [Parachitinimonas caeni]
MISRLTGKLLEKQPPQIVLEVGGIGYEIDVPMSTFFILPNLGESVTLFTHLVIREDAHLLYGFASRSERDTFRELIKVSGIGPKIGLAVLSGMTVDELGMAIAEGNVAKLSRTPGIGKKTAERLVLELRGKLTTNGAAGIPSAASPQTPADSRDEIVHALLALGYNDKEAQAAVKPLPTDTTVTEGLRLALRGLAKG